MSDARRILITGAAGFIGGHVARAARQRDVALTLLSHRRPPADTSPTRTRLLRADLSDRRSLTGVCEGADVLLHCAARIGGSPEENDAVNARGTAELVAQAQRAGVSRIVYMSTASVYGRGVFRRARPEQLTRAPGSPTSRARAEAEDSVLAAGGIVIRPHLVYGPGDAWVVPSLARLSRVLPGDPSAWDARISMIAVPALADLMVRIGLAPAETLTTSVYHAAHPEPVTAGALLGAVGRWAAIPAGRPRVTVAEARRHLRKTEDALASHALASHALRMLATDHWFDATPVWEDLGRTPGPAPSEDLAGLRDWYPAEAA